MIVGSLFARSKKFVLIKERRKQMDQFQVIDHCLMVKLPPELDH